MGAYNVQIAFPLFQGEDPPDMAPKFGKDSRNGVEIDDVGRVEGIFGILPIGVNVGVRSVQKAA